MHKQIYFKKLFMIYKFVFVANYFPCLFLDTNLEAMLTAQSHRYKYTEDSQHFPQFFQISG